MLGGMQALIWLDGLFAPAFGHPQYRQACLQLEQQDPSHIMAPKRSHAEMLGTETPADLRILVTDGQPLMAHREVLRLFSSCVRGLPDGMDWDLKAVQLDGRAVSRDTVSAWVDAVYARIDCSFQARTMHLPQLLQVYNFAEFVGSSSGVMQALADKVCGDNTLLNYIGAVSAVSPNIPCHVTLDMRQIAFYESSDCLYLYDRRFNFREGHHMSTFTDALIAALEEVLYSAVKHEFRQLEKKVCCSSTPPLFCCSFRHSQALIRIGRICNNGLHTASPSLACLPHFASKLYCLPLTAYHTTLCLLMVVNQCTCVTGQPLCEATV